MGEKIWVATQSDYEGYSVWCVHKTKEGIINCLDSIKRLRRVTNGGDNKQILELWSEGPYSSYIEIEEWTLDE